MTTRPKPRAIDSIHDVHEQLDELLATRSEYVGRAGQAEWRSRWNAAMEEAHGRRNALPVDPTAPWQQGRGVGPTASSGKLTWVGGDAVESATGPKGHRVTVVAASGTTPASWNVLNITGHVISRGSSQFTAAAREAATSACPGAMP